MATARPSFTLRDLAAASDEQLCLWLSAITGNPVAWAARRRRTALIGALRNAATLDEPSTSPKPGKKKVKTSPAAEEKEEEKKEEEEKQEEQEEADEVDYPFATLKTVAAKHGIKGRSKAQLLAAMQEQGIDVDAEVAKEVGDGDDEEEEVEKAAPSKQKRGRKKAADENGDDDDDDWQGVDVQAFGRKGSKKGLSKKAEEDGDDDDAGDAESDDDGRPGKRARKKTAKGSDAAAVVVPFTATQLLCATMTELRAFGAQVGAKAKRKDELLHELREMLPRDQQWASSEDGWESIRLPGTNAYDNIDVRDGIASGLVHVHGLRLAPTARAQHIPNATALVGFSRFRGQYTPVTDGIVIRRKDLIKFNAALANKRIKEQRKVVRAEKRQLIPKVEAPWTFDQLPEEERSHLRDFGLLPRDNWIVIFSFCTAADIISCGRVSKALHAVTMLEPLWRAKLYADWTVACEEHKSMPARDAYLALASRKNPCASCQPRHACTTFIAMYRARTHQWLLESIKPQREAALHEACADLGTTIHPGSKLAPTFISGAAGDKSAGEVAAIIEGVSRLFAHGGHRAYSELHDTLHSELVRIKFTKLVTWSEALDIWESKYSSRMSEAASSGYRSSGDDECYNCGRYGHYARDCYYR